MTQVSHDTGVVEAFPQVGARTRDRTDPSSRWLWTQCYRDSLKKLSDVEIRWERKTWRDLGARTMADRCDSVLRQRALCAITVACQPETLTDLDDRWSRVQQRDAIAYVEESAGTLVDALRIEYVVGWRA